MGSGKSHAAHAVQTELSLAGWKTNPMSFATPLRAVLEILTGVPAEMTRAPADKARPLPGDWGMTVGQALQRLGTDAIRSHFHNDAWVRAALIKYDCRAAFDEAEEALVQLAYRQGRKITPVVWIFDDVRFPNEADAIFARGGFVFRIDRPSAAVPDAAAAAAPDDAAVPDAAVPDPAVPDDAAVPDAAVPDAAVPDDAAAETRDPLHASETAMNGYSRYTGVITNSGSAAAYQNAVLDAVGAKLKEWIARSACAHAWLNPDE